MSYVSVEEFKKYSGVYEENDTQKIYIAAAENTVNNFLGYSPTLHSYTQYFDGAGTHKLALTARPIKTLASVEINGANIPLDEFYYANDSEFLCYKSRYPFGKRNIKVAYTAGYGDTPGNDVLNGSFLPAAIRMSVLRIAALLQSESDENIGVTSKSFADSGARTFTNFTSFDKYLSPISFYKLVVI
jgi:hypothetical protein